MAEKGATGDEGSQCATGPQGIGSQGPTGPQGPRGLQSIQGAIGPIGPAGVQGPQCETRPTGPAGIQGPQGESGNDGISCWDLNANSICDIGSEDSDSSGTCDVNDCQSQQVIAAMEARIAALECATFFPMSCPPYKTVFITFEGTNGNFGGTDAADSICQQYAINAGIEGTFMAWVSESTMSPSVGFNKSQVPYRLLDGTT